MSENINIVSFFGKKKKKSFLWVRNDAGGMPSEDVLGKTGRSELPFDRKPFKKTMPKGEVVASCSRTKGFASCCFVFLLLACFCPSVCLNGELECAAMSCPPRGRPSGRSGIRWLIPPFRRHNAFWSKEQIKDFNDWQRFMPLLFLIPWLLTL